MSDQMGVALMGMIRWALLSWVWSDGHCFGGHDQMGIAFVGVIRWALLSWV